MPGPALRRQLEHHLNRRDLEAFLGVIEPHLPGTPGTSTRANTLSSLRAFLSWADHEWRSVLTPDDALASDYLSHLQARVSPITAKNHLSRLHHLYRALHQLGVAPDSLDPFATSTAPQHDFNDSRDAYTPDEVTRLLRHADATGRALILLGAHAGLSARQVVTLTWADVAWTDGELFVRRRAVHDGAALRDTLNRLNRASFSTAPSDRVFDFPDAGALRKKLYLTCLNARVPPMQWRPLRTHAELRVLRERGPECLQALDLLSRRSAFALRALARTDVLQGPRRSQAATSEP